MADEEVTFHKGLQGDYVPVFFKGRNTSGLKPYGKNLLIAVDEFSPISAGGIHFTDQDIEKKTAASVTGCIFAMAAEAFRWFDDGTPWKGDKPEVGDRVCFTRYEGQLQVGADGKTYRFMDYRSLAGGVDKEFVAEEIAAGRLEMPGGTDGQ